MVKTTDIGTYGPANDAIGGEVILYYYDLTSKGRGEVLRLFFEDAQIKFKDVRFGMEEANAMSREERAQYSPVLSFPSLNIGGKQYSQSYPILRYLSRKLGKYDGQTDEERYFVDVICDIAIDWRTSLVSTVLVTDKKGLNWEAENLKPFEHHKSFFLPKFIAGIEQHLTSSSHAKGGPFVLGDQVTYADFVVWQIYHDEREVGGVIEEILQGSAPRLKQLVEGVAARPNVKAYLASDRYYN